VETWAHASYILTYGAAAFKKYGTERKQGTKTLSLTGNVRRTGLVEVPLGMSLRDIIYGVGGGHRPRQAPQGGTDRRAFRRLPAGLNAGHRG
jgi:NADH-quinone oxidoreductase subunit F